MDSDIKPPVQAEAPREALAKECKRLADKYRACPLNSLGGAYQDMCAAIDRLAVLPAPTDDSGEKS